MFVWPMSIQDGRPENSVRPLSRAERCDAVYSIHEDGRSFAIAGAVAVITAWTPAPNGIFPGRETGVDRLDSVQDLCRLDCGGGAVFDTQLHIDLLEMLGHRA